MTYRTTARLFAASLAFAGLAFMASACSDNNPTTTTEELQKARQIDDNAAYSAMVEWNYAQAQVAHNAQSALTDPATIALAKKIEDDSNANLVKLYGTSDINPSGSAAAQGGLGASAGLQLASNDLTQSINDGAAADIASVLGADTSTDPLAADKAFADAEVARYGDTTAGIIATAQGLLDAAQDGGVNITNESLRSEMQSEVSGSWSDDLNQATQVQTNLEAPAGDGGSGS